MATISAYNTQVHLPWLNLESLPSSTYNPIQFKNSSQIQHSPHPSRVRHIRGFAGAPICVVDTDEVLSKHIPSVLFPPNQYADNKMKMAAMNFSLPLHRECSNLVTSKPSLDTILAMKYFTGLRNTSFRDQQVANINPVPNVSGWEERLHSLTTEALSPVLEKFSKIERSQAPEATQRCSTASSMKRMYSSSGRLLTSRSGSRPNTCSSKRPSTTLRSWKHLEDYHVTPELDTQVFYILGGILQIPDPEIVKAWLLTATDRERNLVVEILRSALTDKDELNMFVVEAYKEKQYPRVRTPARCFNSTLHTIREIEGENRSNTLVMEEIPLNSDGFLTTRPPTSSIFRSCKPPSSRPSTRSGEEWIPSESVVAK